MSQRIATTYGTLIHTYVVLGDSAAPIMPVDPQFTLMDAEYLLHDKYGVHMPCIYLIRLDDYVGFRSNLQEGNRIYDYLNRFLIPAVSDHDRQDARRSPRRDS